MDLDAQYMQLRSRTQYMSGVQHLTMYAGLACASHTQLYKECLCSTDPRIGVLFVADYQRTHSTHHALLGIEVSHHWCGHLQWSRHTHKTY